jgi:UDP-2,3-diacylglucosamine hydrolase
MGERIEDDGDSLALFISDLHLQAGHPLTSGAFFDFLAGPALRTQALYVLGDLFEYWAGDDDLEEPFHLKVAQALRAVSDAGVKLYWIAGNRDFLVGERFTRAAGMTLLNEPHVADFKGQRIVLLHGDAECTDDSKYMAFRAMVRNPAWQEQFLAMPLPQRKAAVEGARQNSRADQREKSDEIMDVTPQAIAQVFAANAADLMIHGHTHRPAVHAVGDTRRYVLPDWDLDGDGAARGGWIAVDAEGVIHRHNLDGSELL